jgi:hypothetical protein
VHKLLSALSGGGGDGCDDVVGASRVAFPINGGDGVIRCRVTGEGPTAAVAAAGSVAADLINRSRVGNVGVVV